MPEGDTAHLTATRLHDALAGDVLEVTQLRVPRFATADLAGRATIEVVARGKHILHRIEGGTTIHSHLKMEGSWHVYDPNERWRRPAWQARAVLLTRRAQAVGFQLGIAELLDTAAEDDVVGHLGPDPLGPDWDAAEALTRLVADPARPIGEVLLDQRVVAGPGNVYRCEVMFLRGLHPSTPVGAIDDPAAVIDLVWRLMNANRTTARQVTTGDTRPGRSRWVYGRAGLPCRRCGTPIRNEPGRGVERTTYWCPACQPARRS